MAEEINETFDFSSEDFNGFYYTSEKKIRTMDDAYILSKVVERYPDLNASNTESNLRQVFLAIATDKRFIKDLAKKLDLDVYEVFSIIYRSFPDIFSAAYITKVQKLINGRFNGKPTTGTRKSRLVVKPTKKRRGRPPKNTRA